MTRVRISGSSLPDPIIKKPNGEWELCFDYFYTDAGHSLKIPAGFRFDLASIPRPFWWAIAPFELSIVAPLIHDWLYRNGGNPPYSTRPFTRKEADVLFRDIMKQEGVPRWRRSIATFAVRRFGASAWRA